MKDFRSAIIESLSKIFVDYPESNSVVPSVDTQAGIALCHSNQISKFWRRFGVKFRDRSEGTVLTCYPIMQMRLPETDTFPFLDVFDNLVVT